MVPLASALNLPSVVCQAKRNPKFLHNRTGDLLLELEYARKLAIEVARPEVKAVFRVDELRGDADCFAFRSYAAFDDRTGQWLDHPYQFRLGHPRG